MDTLLRSFNGDVHTKEALVAFLHDSIDQEALKRLYAKQDVSSVADARELIDKAFEQLSISYGITATSEQPTNQAR